MWNRGIRKHKNPQKKPVKCFIKMILKLKVIKNDYESFTFYDDAAENATQSLIIKIVF